jgi:hypothetical protein
MIASSHPSQTMDDYLINQPTADMSKEAIQRGAVERGAGVAFVVEALRYHYPPKAMIRRSSR